MGLEGGAGRQQVYTKVLWQACAPRGPRTAQEAEGRDRRRELLALEDAWALRGPALEVRSLGEL